MTRLIAALWLLSNLAAGAAWAQPAPFNEVGVTMGHWHLASKDAEANKKIFLGMGGELIRRGNAESIRFPGVLINLTLRAGAGNGGAQGTVGNHGGLIDDNEHDQAAQLQANGGRVAP